MKVAPLMRAFATRQSIEARIVHTGQHYDDKLSKIFFDELGIPRPDVELEVGSGTLAVQTAEVMRRFEPVLVAEQPHAVLVVGDVNSTIACSLVTARFHRNTSFRWIHGVRTRPVVIHVEAGLRSFDDDMPEEINRRLTDAASDVLFVSEASGMKNLAKEGVPADRCFFVGNVMIDTLMAARERAMQSSVIESLGLAGRAYGLLTLHRPSNVDDPVVLQALLDTLDEIARDLPLPAVPQAPTATSTKPRASALPARSAPFATMTDEQLCAVLMSRPSSLATRPLRLPSHGLWLDTRLGFGQVMCQAERKGDVARRQTHRSGEWISMALPVRSAR